MIGTARSARAAFAGASWLRHAWAACLAFFMLAIAAPVAFAQTEFDHQSTGFPLTGAHSDVRCETCHVKAIFKGTPRRCDQCHVQNNLRNATTIPSNHVQTTLNCDVCHTTATFSGARFDHALVAGQTCAACHNGSQAVGKPANHPLTNAPCSDCHTTISFSTVTRPANHIPTLASSRCESCHLNMASGGSLANAQMDHTGYTTCAQCHAPAVANSFYGVQIKSSLTAPPHIPASDNCELCHTSIPTMLIPTTGAASVGATTFAGGRMNHAGITSNCVSCHGSSVVAGTFIGVTPKTKAGLAPPHLPTSETCENCHRAVPAQLIPTAGAASIGATSFANAQMNHVGITSNCVDCHGPTVTGSSFYGVSRVVTMPPTSAMGPNSHIPSSTTCESCHLGTLANVSGTITANATRTAPGTLFATPAPTSAQIHAGVTGGCSNCHESSYLWMGMSAYPISPAMLTTGANYTGFHTRPRAAAGTFNVADPAHPASGDCSLCHSNTNAFSALDKPANHIPYAAGAQCTSCHTNPDFSVMPTLAAIHANAPSTTGNCAQCHSATAATAFAIPSIGFRIVAPPSNHVPTSAPCESCHVGAGSSVATTPVPNGATFANSRMNHAGITNNCVACHTASGSGTTFAGITSIVRMPPMSPPGPSSHIPSSTTCESCHLASLPMGQIPANATLSPPGTGFATPAPTAAQIHSGITGGCSNCHEANYVWMGMSAYPISPAVLTAGAQYTGFQTRPRAAAGTFNVADAAHPATGDCSQCHSGFNYFTAQATPANHIPYASTAQCASCHTNPDFSVMPTLANIHANAQSTTSNCAQCHGDSAASFAIPAANFSIVGKPSTHIPTNAPCEACHVGQGSSVATTPVPNGATFANSRMSHTGITNNCENCHTPASRTTAFAGITNIVRMPATSPVGASSHIPSGTACAGCHLGTLANVSGLIPANATRSAPGTLFATPAPTSAQIHSGISSGCSNCHEANYVWMGMSTYPISPAALTAGAQYTGFHTRPRAAAGTFNVADAAHPATGDCAQCHSNFNYFTAQDKPANHIPYATTAQCASCHTNPDFSVMPTLANIHANAQSTTSNCAQCHSATAAAAFAIPAANFTIVAPPSNHIPTSAACELCHVGAGSSVTSTPVPDGAKFSGSRMSHTGITNNCVACHTASGSSTTFAGITSIVRMPPTSPPGPTSHVPSGTACESCHLGTLANVSGLIPANATRSAPGTLFATPAPTSAQIHSGISSGCGNCHEANYVWMGMSAYPISPAVLTAGAQYTGFHTRPRAAAGTFNVADAAHPATGDCAQCHSGFSYFSAQDKPANHIPYATTAQCTSCHTNPDFSVMPALANIHANAQSTTSNCAQCHSTTAAATFAIPAANFTIVAPPSNHIPTSAPCESCHIGAGSSITSTPVPNGAKFSGSRMNHAGITNNCVACHTASGSATTFAGITNIVRMPPTSPPGPTSHVPSGTACESCHLGTLANVSGLIPANATRSAPGTLFATPAPTSAQIHSGITSGCNACHDTGYVWMGMSAYPISPTTLIAGAQYTGFHTRPVAAASTFSVADAAHPTTGDCSQCHSGFSYFSAQAKPPGHIPTQAPCTTCHVVPGDFSIAGLTTNMATMHTGITSGCIACHTAGAGAGPFAGCATQAACSSPPPLTYQPKTMPLAAGTSPMAPSPQTHVPAVGIACEKCHVTTTFATFSGMQMKGNTTAHQAVSAYTCITCHEGTPKYTWYGVTIVTRPVGHEGRKAGQDCVGSGCHRVSYNQFVTSAVLRPVLRAANIAPRLLPGGVQLPHITQPSGITFDHQGVLPGQCKSCHNGVAARGLSAKHLPTQPSCDTCHRTTTWLPAQFSHQGIAAGGCTSCHDGARAPGKSSGHFMTARSCDTCHRVATWLPAAYSHVSPAYRPTPDKPFCVSCHVTNGEIIPRVMHSNPRLRPVPVTP
ncbi:MAG TPA: hypothetical protein VLE94_06655 [Burkholderiaceae bacterium]|nr:hypothetical protein [Burkholderiaceae bacterium]